MPDFIVQGGDPTNTGSGLLFFWKDISYMFYVKVVKVSMVFLLKMSFTADLDWFEEAWSLWLTVERMTMGLSFSSL